MSLLIKIKHVITIILVLMTAFSFGQVELERHDNLNQNALRFWYSDANKPSHKFNRNISPKNDCVQYVNGYFFFTWYKGGMNNRRLMLSRLNTATNSWVTIQFPDRNSLYGSGEYQGGGNSHRTTNVAVSTLDGTVHLLYDMHADELKYRVSNKNIAFAPDSQFTLSNFSAKRNYFRPGEPILRCTYPNTQVNKKGELITEYRIGTSRQGDKYLVVYGSNGWSKPKLVMQGNNENPEYNQYGGFAYYFDQLYMGCSVRIKGSPIGGNQGFYFAKAGENGVDQDWEDIKGNTHGLPIKGMTQMNRLRVARPLPNGHNGMTSEPAFVVSKNGAVHFTNRIPGEGTVHYIAKAGSTTMEKASGGSPNVSFPGDDGRVYSVGTQNDKIRIQSTKEGTNDWRTDFTSSGSEKFGLLSHEYKDGKIYIIAAEKKESDKLPLHYFVLKLNNVNSSANKINSAPSPSSVQQGQNITIPVGYEASATREIVVMFQLDTAPWTLYREVRATVNQGSGTKNININIPSNVPVANNAYQFQTFLAPPGGSWGDRLSNIEKKNVSVISGDTGGPEGYTFAANEGGIVQVTGTVNIAYGANGVFEFFENITSDTPCNNATLGDPIPGSFKKCYIKPVSTNPPSGNCSFGTPTSSGLPSIANGDYSNISVLGNGPNLSNLKKFRIKWNAGENKLTQFAFNTRNGNPSYYVDLRSKIQQNFRNSNPSVQISGSGIGVDGDYWVTRKGSDFVMVSKNGNYTLYFSTSSSQPSCSDKAPQQETSVTVYPNPVKSILNISGLTNNKTIITVSDITGKRVLVTSLTNGANQLNVQWLKTGLYFINFKGNNDIDKTLQFIKN